MNAAMRLWCCMTSSLTAGADHSDGCCARAAHRADASGSAIPTGPFAEAPLELAQWVYDSPVADVALPAQLWLRGVLRDAGVELGEHDRRVIVDVVRALDRPALQALGGWVARANRGVNLADTDERPSITCPRCHHTSWNPTAVREGYCGACHDWTSPRTGDR